MMCLVLLKFLLLQSGLPPLEASAAPMPVAMPFWIVSPPAGLPPRQRHAATRA